MVPLLALILAFIFNLPSLFVTIFNTKFRPKANYRQYHNHSLSLSKGLLKTMHIWTGLLLITIMYSLYDLYLKNNSQRTPENVITSYYDALDLKELEKSFYYIDPFSNVSISQYMLEIAVTDGLLNSYAKLDALEILILKKTDSLVTLKIATNWVTPLEKVNKVNYKTVVKRGNKWYIVPNQLDSDSPPDQLYSNNITKYFNQGRKKISTEQTYHEDVLKQPVLEIISAKLVKFKNHFALIGEIQNIDNVPADIVLKGTLYNDESKELAIYNAKYHVKHKLMPKEISSFRINFEGIAWTKTADAIPETFNPDEFTPIAFEEQPTNFNLQVAGNVSNSDLYKDLALSDLKINSTTIKGTLFNSGLQEITVPQLLISYYDKNKNIVWVDHLFLKRGIRQQRKKYFEYALLKNDSIAIINNDMSNCFVNGLPNKNISSKIVPNRIKKHSTIALQKIIHPNYAYVKIEMNSYIGNPN